MEAGEDIFEEYLTELAVPVTVRAFNEFDNVDSWDLAPEHRLRYDEDTPENPATKRWFSIKDIKRIIANRKQYCEICQEDYARALDFHHKDPGYKRFAISQYIPYIHNLAQSTFPLDSVAELILEMDKCVVLCSNCHRKVHGGVLKLPPGVGAI